MPARLNFLGLSCVALLAWVPITPAGAAGANNIAGPASADKRAHVDEVALRYYASQRQTTRVEAEIRRLRKLHPGWQPPSDLWTLKVGTSDDRELWSLFAANKLDELHAAIAARRAKDGNWKPSADLELKLRQKEFRTRVIADGRFKRWNDLISIADRWQSDVASDDLETLWLVAEAYARASYASEALQVLSTAMKGAPNAGDRISTIQKALSLSLPMNGIDKLLALGKSDASGKSEFDAIAIDITRARISTFLRDLPCKEVSAAEYAKFQDFATSAADPRQIALLGWYALKQSRTNDALEYFKSAISKGDDATVAQGLIVTLKKLGRLRDAEEVAYAWRGTSSANMALFIDVVADQLAQRVPVDTKRITRYADVVLQTTSGEGAEALGWYAYDTCQTEAASEWFKRTLAWLPRETAVLGYAVALQRLHRMQELVQIVNRYDGLFPSVVAVMFPDNPNGAADRCQALSADAASLKNAAATGSLSRAAFHSQATHGGWKQTGLASVPLPNQLQSGAQEMSAVTRGEFPVAVSPENPFRWQSSDRPSTTKSAVTVWRPTDPVTAITSARRVSGVGAMPYERLGRTLLPGYSGLQSPSSSPGRMLDAPRGTLWAAEQATAPSATAQTTPPATGQFSGISAAANAAAVNRFHP